LYDHNTVLVDDVDGASGPKVVGTLRIDPADAGLQQRSCSAAHWAITRACPVRPVARLARPAPDQRA
jgi:hypothetical protein